MSSGSLSGFFDFGSKMAPLIRANRITGMFTRNTDPHQKCSSSHPDAIGPIAAPPPETPAQIAIALGRSSEAKTFVRIDRVDGMMNAAANPMTARPAITVVELSAVAETSEPMRNSTRPACSAPLRPNRSPIAPAVKSSPAKISEYASTIHCSELVEASSSRASVGNATLRVVLPMMTIIRLVHNTPRITQRRENTTGSIP